MKRQLELAALGLGITGWLCAILTRCLPLWKVSDGVWLEWDHWDLNHDGSLHCSFYQSLGLIMACIGAVVITWTCHHMNKPLEGTVVLRRDWGAALYTGWIYSSLMVVGGGYYTQS
uniref:Uncharacterized protein n=1 Tax=Salmo trutta TaxID=8032 RepID=A0A674EFV6_SALTR